MGSRGKEGVANGIVKTVILLPNLVLPVGMHIYIGVVMESQMQSDLYGNSQRSKRMLDAKY